MFREWYPMVLLDPNVLFVDEGDVLTSAGAASGIDVCLHLIRKDQGSELANQAAREWAVQHLQQPLTLRDLAEHSHMSQRTFARGFNEKVGMSPGRWLFQQRVDRARHLLESTDRSIDEVAGSVGFGASPRAYRRTFRGVPAQNQ